LAHKSEQATCAEPLKPAAPAVAPPAWPKPPLLLPALPPVLGPPPWLGAPACMLPAVPVLPPVPLLPAVGLPPPGAVPPVEVLAPLDDEPDVAPLPPVLVPSSPGKLLPAPVLYPSP
jgi:hypothetical protein